MDFNGTKRRLITRASQIVGAIDPHLGAPKTWLRSGNDMQLPRALNWLRSLISMHYRINLDLSVTNNALMMRNCCIKDTSHTAFPRFHYFWRWKHGLW
jgi:hypothetical protein